MLRLPVTKLHMRTGVTMSDNEKPVNKLNVPIFVDNACLSVRTKANFVCTVSCKPLSSECKNH